MNLNVTKQIETNTGTIIANDQIMNVKQFEFHFIDFQEEMNIPCLTIWYDNDKRPSNGDYTIIRVIRVESF